MKSILTCLLLFFLFGIHGLFAQDSLSVQTPAGQINSNKLKIDSKYEPLAPSKAAFYSAVLPGLGQAMNGSYWKIPLVYGGLGGGVYFYIKNDKEFNKYRDAYKRRLAGYNDDEYQGQISDEGLIQAQKQFRKNKEISIFFTVIWYALNIVDANVEAHLKQFNVSENLSIKPDYHHSDLGQNANYGLSLNLKF